MQAEEDTHEKRQEGDQHSEGEDREEEEFQLTEEMIAEDLEALKKAEQNLPPLISVLSAQEGGPKGYSQDMEEVLKTFVEKLKKFKAEKGVKALRKELITEENIDQYGKLLSDLQSWFATAGNRLEHVKEKYQILNSQLKEADLLIKQLEDVVQMNNSTQLQIQAEQE